MNARWRAIALLALAALLAACGEAAPTATSTTPSATAPSSPSAPTAVPSPTIFLTPTGLRGTIVDVINTVDAHAMPDWGWQEAVAEMAIYEQGQVRAQEASTARVSVEEALVRVAPNSIFTLGQPDADTVQMNLEEGQMWINVEGLAPGASFEVETPAAVASVRGTLFAVRATAAGTTTVSVWGGEVAVSAMGVQVMVLPNMQTIVVSGTPPLTPTAMPYDEQLRWGMATKPSLDVMLPVVGDPISFIRPGLCYRPSWSPDGRYLGATCSLPTGSGNFVVDVPEASGIVPNAQLLDGSAVPADAFYVTLRPVVGGVSYVRDSPEGEQICTVGADWATTDCFLAGSPDCGPLAWAPDGNQLLYYCSVSSDYHIFLASPDGSTTTQLTSGPGANVGESWSPDGQWIAYLHTNDWGDPGQLWTMRADGSDARLVLEGVAWNGHIAGVWSPDGAWLVVVDFSGQLVMVRPDGSEVVRLPGTEGWDCGWPVWTPIGDGWPLFFAGRDPGLGAQHMWILSEATASPMLLATDIDAPDDWGPLWSPDMRRVAFGFRHWVGDEPQSQVYVFQLVPEFWP